MAQEIKSIDVENDAEDYYINLFHTFGWELKSSQRVYNQDSRPVGAISYEGVTYVHSQTNTVDFTKLVFERDTKMPNYSELKDLEDEFWILSETISQGKPYMPPDADTMEKWAKYFEPDLRTKWEKIRLHVIFGIFMVGLLFLSLYYFYFWVIFYLLSNVVGVVWFFGNKAAKRHALKVAIDPKQSYYRSALEALYNEVIEKIDNYCRSVARAEEILDLANQLLDNLA